MEIQPLDHSDFEIYCTQRNDLYSERWVQENNQRWMTYCFFNLLLVLVKIMKLDLITCFDEIRIVWV
jgi:hypothetical protein